MKTEKELLENIDASFITAAKVLELGDVPEELEEDELNAIYESRHHCGTCMVRTVMEVVWPAVEEYLDWMQGKAETGNEENEN